MSETNANSLVKDHAVSGEEFELIYDPDYKWLKTFPHPGKDDIHRYYESPDYISHTDSRRNLFEKIYHLVKQFNLKRKYRILEKYHPEPATLLDIGCGTGDFLSFCQRKGWDISGIEPSDSARAIASAKTNISIYGNSGWTRLENQKYDCISLWHVLEHLYSPSAEIERYSKMLNQNGSIILAVPNYRSFDASFYKSFWAAWDVPRHLWHFSQQSIHRLATENGLKVAGVYPMLFDAYYVSLLSEKYRSGWMNIFNAFFVATRSNLSASRTGEYSSLIYVLKSP